MGAPMPGKLHLFAVTHWLLKAATIFAIFIMALLGLVLGALLVIATNPDGFHLGLPAILNGIARIKVMAIAAFAISCGLICFALIFFALRATAQIVESAISGDPFVNENAKRLARIGWLLLTTEILGLLAHPIFDYMVSHLIPENLRGQANLHFGNFGFEMSPIGLLAILLIFVLAQIFRRGSEMRAELEATV
jgi:hypothetical protein